MLRALCVFCGASSGRSELYTSGARAFGQALAAQGLELVWGGGHVGLMGVVADAVLDGGGRAHGVIPSFMVERELGHPRATTLHVVDSMHARKAKMAELADGFVVLPGGLGSLEEFFEVLTWAQLQIQNKPIGILNTNHFYAPLLAMLEHLVREGFVAAANLDLISVAEEPLELLERLRAYQPPAGDWLEKVDLKRT
jgi:uncharacterized protein (TIGR00730 family)